MKNGLHINPFLFKMVLLVTCFMLVMFYNKSKGETVTNASTLHNTVAMR